MCVYDDDADEPVYRTHVLYAFFVDVYICCCSILMIVSRVAVFFSFIYLFIYLKRYANV